MSDRHIRLLRQAAKAARTRLAVFVEEAPTEDHADDEVTRARTARALRRRASNTENQLRDAEQRRDDAPAAPEPPRDGPPAPVEPTPIPLQRGSDGVLRLPPRH